MSRTPEAPSAASFSYEEAAVLQRHGLAVFRGRIILDARDPISDREVAAVEGEIGTTIPSGLLELWKVSYGGRLDYDLTVPLSDHVYAASFTELFWPDNDGYRDLLGWIEHEWQGFEDAADSRGEAPPNVLPVLPFGGFEYLERVYVRTAGTDRGAVTMYAQGLPLVWKGYLNQNTVARVADSVDALFSMLELQSDPRTADPKESPMVSTCSKQSMAFGRLTLHWSNASTPWS